MMTCFLHVAVGVNHVMIRAVCGVRVCMNVSVGVWGWNGRLTKVNAKEPGFLSAGG